MSYISKLSTIAVVFVCLGAFSQSAEARRGHHYDGYGHHGYGYGYGYRHGYGHRRHHDHSGAYLAGGLIVGSLLTHAWHRSYEPRYYEPRVYTSSRVIVERPARVVRRTTTVSRHLFRDRDGNCFEKRYRAGEELMTELDPRECDW